MVWISCKTLVQCKIIQQCFHVNQLNKWDHHVTMIIKAFGGIGDGNHFIERTPLFTRRTILQPEVRKSVEELEILLDDDFIEFGSSGRIFNKQQVIDGLVNEPIIQMTLMDFEVKLLAPDVALTTYRVLKHKDMKYSLRSSIWKRKEDKWQMVFYQEHLQQHLNSAVGK